VYPTLFDFFGLNISSFGFMVGVAVVVGTYVGERMFVEAKLSRDLPWSLAIVGFISGGIGSKIWYIGERLSRGDSFSQLLENRAGMTFYGGLIIGVLTLWGYSQYRKVSFWIVLHLISVPLALAQCIGRIGCFLVGDDYGRPSNLPWAFAFPEGAPPTFVPVHPTMLYESAWLAAVSLLLWSRRQRSSFLFGEYLMLAGIGRFVVELWRINPALLGPLSNAQLTAVGLFTLGAGLWIYRTFRGGSLKPQLYGSPA